ncbi:serine/threonine protein kinase [Streptomyces cavernicola]|uniref:Serine/threonine protein kinase n=1 Tax=Streptomyces cavernicola TaxID=3043613 RepID=A0ABT6S7B4_9ACTN|nr:serine/threonine protein kinase [Streptomyces sp. B-S-A6]MDI3403927.1 serine/threonine protein kinase [Streptomyces sp. B-S-A6]
MDTVIVQLPEEPSDRPGSGRVPGRTDRPRLLRLGPGDTADFGRGAPDVPVPVTLDDPAVSRRAGQIVAAEDYWRLSNFSRTSTYVVQNLEGAGEHVKVAPGRVGAPVPFEFSRVLLPGTDGEATFKVFAPEHAYLDGGPAGERAASVQRGEPTTSPFALDPTSKYFLVLLALCEPRLRRPSSAAVPGVGEVVERLRGLDGCAGLTRSAVNYHIDYLTSVKLRLRDDGGSGVSGGSGRGSTGSGSQLTGKREELVAFALRFDLVREEHLPLLPRRGGGVSAQGPA